MITFRFFLVTAFTVAAIACVICGFITSFRFLDDWRVTSKTIKASAKWAAVAFISGTAAFIIWRPERIGGYILGLVIFFILLTTYYFVSRFLLRNYKRRE